VRIISVILFPGRFFFFCPSRNNTHTAAESEWRAWLCSKAATTFLLRLLLVCTCLFQMMHWLDSFEFMALEPKWRSKELAFFSRSLKEKQLFTFSAVNPNVVSLWMQPSMRWGPPTVYGFRCTPTAPRNSLRFYPLYTIYIYIFFWSFSVILPLFGEHHVFLSLEHDIYKVGQVDLTLQTLSESSLSLTLSTPL